MYLKALHLRRTAIRVFYNILKWITNTLVFDVTSQTKAFSSNMCH